MALVGCVRSIKHFHEHAERLGERARWRPYRARAQPRLCVAEAVLPPLLRTLAEPHEDKKQSLRKLGCEPRARTRPDVNHQKISKRWRVSWRSFSTSRSSLTRCV